MAKLLKRGKMWYSNFVVKVYGEDGEPSRDADGKFVYTKIRWALESDKELAIERQSELLKVRREADKKNVPFQNLYQAKNQVTSNRNYQSFKTKYLDKRKTEFKPDTYDHDERAFRMLDKAAATMKPPVVLSSIDDITPRLLDDARTIWVTSKIPPSAVNRALRAIKQAMREAAAFGEARAYDWKIVKKAKGENEHRTHFFTIDEVRTQIAKMPGIYKTVAYLGNRGGRRIGEIYHLKWSGVDFTRGTIANDKIPGVWAPKSKKSYEPVPMKRDLREYLLKLEKTATDEWVISAADKPTLRGMGVYFVRLLRKFGIKKGSVHTCRHTFASHLVQNGADLYSVSKLMRHSSIKQTERYAHLRPPDLRRSVDNLPEL